MANNDQRLLSVVESAKYLGISKATFYKYNIHFEVRPKILLDTKELRDKKDLDKWIDEHAGRHLIPRDQQQATA